MDDDALRDRLLPALGQPMSRQGPALAPDPVNVPMIRHWVAALDDRNPIYLDPEAAAGAGLRDVAAPPAMLQTWTMPTPRLEGIAERGGAPGEIDTDSPLAVLAGAGYTGTLATNSELEFARYLHPGDRLTSAARLADISERKVTGLGRGYFVTWATTYTDQDGAIVGQQSFRVFKFDPSTAGMPAGPKGPRKPPPPAPARLEELPALEVPLTATLIVAGALATRDFMPVHHDRDYAQAQGAPDIFMNILTSNGYVARYVTDWAGPAARLRTIAIRLGAPAVPGTVLSFTGAVTGRTPHEGGELIEVTLRAATSLGEHLSGTVTLARTGGARGG